MSKAIISLNKMSLGCTKVLQFPHFVHPFGAPQNIVKHLEGAKHCDWFGKTEISYIHIPALKSRTVRKRKQPN